MSTMYKQWKTDGKLESKGIELDFGTFTVTIARAGGANKKFAKIMEAKTKPYRRAIQTETMNTDLAEDILYQVYVESVILNWETVVDGKLKQGIENPDPKGKLLSFNRENVLATFRAIPDLFNDIKEQATKAALFREDILEAAAGN